MQGSARATASAALSDPRRRDDGPVEPFPPTRRLLYADYTVLCTRPDGSISADPEGLFDHDTRILSGYRLELDGRPPELLSSAEAGADRRVTILLWPRPGGDAAGPQLPQDVLEVRVDTIVGPGMAQWIEVRNRSMCPVRVRLALRLRADFRDVMDVGRPRRHRGRTTVEAVEGGLTLVHAARRGDRRLERGLRVRAATGPSPEAGGSADPAVLGWPISLAAGEGWAIALSFERLVDGRWEGTGRERWRARRRERAGWDRRRVAIASEPPLLGEVAERALDDLFELRNRELDGGGAEGWVPSAGMPVYTGLFGRDTLTAGWQAALLGPPQLSRGSLDLLGRHQATDDEPFRDAQPGKLLHELRRGPLSELDILPQRAYYGSQTTPAMFVLALSEAWHRTGETDLLRRHRDTALRALAWAEGPGDPDGDGFLEARTRSPGGLRNQGWKDSDEAIRYPDGRIVEPPLATVEEQAFHALALERMAEILVALEEDEEADRFLERAERLRTRWHEAFWLPEQGFYAMALDPDRQAVASVGSNPGHALASGIIPVRHARQVAERLLAPDLFSGWGVRTLSSRHPSYNPFGYHLGTVWPVEQATFALGMKRYGLDEAADRLAAAVLSAAAAFRDRRLPELISGLGRDECPLPVPYPEANSPQAWSASATVQLVQAMLGLYPFAPLGILALVRPRLPAGVEEVRIRRLRVGSATVSLRFRRREDGTAAHEVLEQQGRLLVVDAAPPQDVDGRSPLDAVRTWAVEHAPGRQARALRIALGLERPEEAGRS